MKLLIGLLVFAGALFGQGANTVYQQMFSNQVVPGPSATARNIGAQYQQLTVTVATASGASSSCSNSVLGGAPPTVVIILEASQDQTTWFQIGVATTVVKLGFTYVSTAGSFPYVRANLLTNSARGPSSDRVCAITAWYAGTITGFPTGTAPTIAANDNFVRASGLVSATGSTNITLQFSCLNASAAIYGMTVTSDSTTPVAGSITFGGIITATRFAFTSAGTLIWSQSSRPWWIDVFTAGAPITLTVTTLTTGTVSAYVTYRCE